MKYRSENLNPQKQEKGRERNTLFLLILFLLVFACLISILVPQLFGSAEDSGSLPVALHSFREADYSTDMTDNAIPAIGIGIISEILRDLKLAPEEYQDRMANIIAVILLPIPTSTGILASPRTPAPTATATLTALPASTGMLLATPTITPSPTIKATSTSPQTQTIPPLPMATKTIFLKTNPGNHTGQTKTPKPSP